MTPTQPLTLTPSRFGTEFTPLSTALITPDRKICHLGNQVDSVYLPDLSVLEVALVMPNIFADEGEEFKYRVLIIDEVANIIFHGFIVMPDIAATLFDLIPEEKDLNSCTDSPLTSNVRSP